MPAITGIIQPTTGGIKIAGERWDFWPPSDTGSTEAVQEEPAGKRGQQ